MRTRSQTPVWECPLPGNSVPLMCVQWDRPSSSSHALDGNSVASAMGHEQRGERSSPEKSIPKPEFGNERQELERTIHSTQTRQSRMARRASPLPWYDAAARRGLLPCSCVLLSRLSSHRPDSTSQLRTAGARNPPQAHREAATTQRREAPRNSPCRMETTNAEHPAQTSPNSGCAAADARTIAPGRFRASSASRSRLRSMPPP